MYVYTYIYIYPTRTSQRTQCVSVTQASPLEPDTEITVYCEKQKKHTNALRGQNAKVSRSEPAVYIITTGQQTARKACI
jgi:hypothetical protein